MSIGNNIKRIREQKGLSQKEVNTELGLDKSSYSKLEKETREVKISELIKLSSLFNMSVTDIINYEGDIPSEVTIEDKSAIEQMKLIGQLDEDDKQTIFKLIDKMLTNNKFKTFFQENISK